VRRDHEGVARAISFTATRKDIFEISTTMEVTWVASFEVDAAGVVTTRTVTPDDPGALAAEIEEYCGNRSCPD
jgi:hypothetical protein